MALKRMTSVGYIRTRPKSIDDRNGVDFWVDYRDLQIPVQIKSSTMWARFHSRRFPNIPVLVIREDTKVSTIQHQIWIVIHSYYEKQLSQKPQLAMAQ